jgi:hypothetical protein
MKLTAEQRFLTALIKFHMSETAGSQAEQKTFKDACKAYLDQFREVKEKLDQFTDASKKVELDWTPEVGKLYILNEYAKDIYEYYKSIANVEVGEICELMGETDWSERIYRMKTKAGIFEITDKCAAKYLTPIAELEGLEVGDSVYGIAYQKYTHPWHITGITGSLIFVKKHGESAILTLNKHGFSYEIGSTQLFWRTADRAERLAGGE